MPDQDRAKGPPLSSARGNRDRRKVDRRLDTWKEIGAFFGRDERTVKRWEATRNLPVHRVPGSGRATVYAYVSELERWLESAEVVLAEPIVEPAITSAPEPLPAMIQEVDPEPSESNLPLASPEPDSAPGPDPEINASTDSSVLTTAPPFPAPPKLRPGRAKLYVAALILLAGITASLGYRLRSGSSQPLSPPGKRAVNTEAQEFYLKGEYYLQKRTPDSLTLAVDNYTQAIVHDPGYAQAYAGLADCYNLLREYTAMPDNEAYPRALAAAKQAIALDDSLASAHSALAFVDFFWLLDVASAEHEFRRSIQLDPNSVNARHWYASLPHAPRPISGGTGGNQQYPGSRSFVNVHPLRQGIDALLRGSPGTIDRTLETTGVSGANFSFPRNYLAAIYLDAGNYTGYLDEASAAAHLLQDPDRIAIVDAATRGFHDSGKEGMFEAILTKQRPLYEANRLPAFSIAETHARLGHPREALNYLHISFTHREPAIVGIRMSAGLKTLHKEPEYRGMLAQLGFPPLPE